MVHCPSCGSLNKEGSKFCNECGAALPSPDSRPRCKACGTLNPPENVFCDKCGERLRLPFGGLREAEPAAAGPGAEEAEPDWLRQLRTADSGAPAAPEQPAPAPAPEPEPEAPAEPEVVPPDWLTGASAESPDWLHGAGVPEQPAPAEPARAEEPAAPAPGAPPPTTPAVPTPAEDLPDWLRELSLTAGAKPPVAPAPPATPAPPAPSMPVLPAEPGGEELPDWLRTTAPARPQTGPLPPLPEPAPPPPPPPPAAAQPSGPEALAPAELPDWLRALRPAEAAPAPEAAPEQPVSSEEMPEWLAQLTPAPGTGAAPELASADLPDWLLDLAPPPIPPTTPPAPPKVEAVPPARPAEPVVPAERPPEPLPDFATVPLAAPPRPAPAPPRAEAAPPAQPPVPVAPAERPPQPPPPDLGLGLPAEELAPAELPDWLREVSGTSTVAPSELPDWLAGLGMGAGEPTAPAGAEWQAPAAPPPVEAAAPPAGEPVRGETVPPAAPGEIPEWLREIPGAPGIPGVPEAAEIAPGPPTGLAPAEIPDWLHAMRPEAAGPAPAELLPPSGGAEWAVGAGGLVQATIPEWLEALKPRELREPGAAEVAAPPELAETSGVLAGIRGVIAAEPIVAVPRQTTAVPPIEVPPEHRQLADLLSKLASGEGAAAPRVVLRTTGVRSAAERGVIYLLVLIAALLPLLGTQIAAVHDALAPLFPDPLPAGALSRDAAQAAYTSLEQLQPAQDGSAPTVLLGLETGAGGYGELRPVAVALVDHLAAKQARIIVVSTQPAGPGLAQQLLTTDLPQANVRSVTAANLGFLPGGPMGLAMLASGSAGAIGADFRGDQNWADAVAVSSVVVMTPDGRAAIDLSRVQQIVVVTNDAQVLRNWVEQVHARVPGVPMVAGVSAAGEPLALAYWQPGVATSPLTGVISGVAGADRYGQLRNAQAADLAASRPARGVAQLFVALLIVVGAGVYGLGGLIRKGQS